MSANHVERHALLCTFAVERTFHDYGIDQTITTFDRQGMIEPGLILTQLRVTDRLVLVDGGRAVRCRLERSHLAHWLSETMPFILVLYDGRKDVGYWVYLQAHFEAQPDFDLARAPQQVTVRIPRGNILITPARK